MNMSQDFQDLIKSGWIYFQDLANDGGEMEN